ncbi:hypothetical protein V1511DRAFT_517914 [Dipodascopsis uninucleata]
MTENHANNSSSELTPPLISTHTESRSDTNCPANSSDELVSTNENTTSKPGSKKPSLTKALSICSTCQKAFRRPEHLRRHARTHLPIKPFPCSICGKAFARTDILHRHEQNHTKRHQEQLLAAFRACLSCARSRVKCSGGSPCSRCTKCSTQCQYPSSDGKQALDSADVDNSAVSIVREGGPTANNLSNSSPGVQRTMSATLEKNDIFANGQDVGLSQSRKRSIDTIQHDNVVTDTIANSTEQSPTATSAYYTQPSGGHGIEVESINWLPLHVLTSSQQDINFDSDSYLASLISDWFPSEMQNTATIAVEASGNPAQVQHLSPTEYPVDLAANVDNSSIIADSSSSPALTVSATDVSDSSFGSLYVDGAAIRRTAHRKVKRPKVKILDCNSSMDHTQSENESSLLFCFPDNVLMESELQSNEYCEWIGSSVYKSAVQQFENLCCSSIGLFRPFRSTTFPSLENFNICISLYFSNFNIAFPVVHRYTFDNARSLWLISLALAATGSAFLTVPEQMQFYEAFQEFLRRAIIYVIEYGDYDHLEFSQVLFLSMVGLSQGQKVLRSKSGPSQTLLYNLLLRDDFPDSNEMSVSSFVKDKKQTWMRWIRQETKRRLLYCSWIVDSLLALQSNISPQMMGVVLEVQLPCLDALWDASNEETWERLFQVQEPMPSLNKALQSLYLQNKLLIGFSELSHMILVYGICERTQQIGKHLQLPMARWIPTGSSNKMRSVAEDPPNWLPSDPLYSRWRNSALDCLDVIHWYANSITAKGSGLEQPLILHLHLSRVLLLSPLHEILDLIGHLLSDKFSGEREYFFAARSSRQVLRVIWRWLYQDQHKARLCLIHAGVIFWHVRRYSICSFFEPAALFLASAVLWTYSCYNTTDSGPTILNQREKNVTNTVSESIDDVETLVDAPSFIHLDRPCDDEIVQIFVRRGHTMQGHISGVGNICSPGAPARILKEGIRLLDSVGWEWGISREYRKVMLDLAEID